MQKNYDVLVEKLRAFFDCGVDESNPVFLFLINAIFENVPVDERKLSFALDSLSQLRQQPDFMSYNTQFNIFDTTLEGFEDISLKGFSSKNKPIIYFYKGAETQPFFKIKLEKGEDSVKFIVETSSDSELLTKFKNKKEISTSNSAYVMLDTFVATSEGCYSTKYMSAMSKSDDEAFSYNIKSYPDEYEKFYHFVSKYIKTLGKDVEQLNSEALFASFYDVIKRSTSCENEFSFIDIISIIDNVLSSGESVDEVSQDVNSLSNYVLNICQLENHKEGMPKRRIIDIDDTSSRLKYIEIVKSEQYLSMDIFDEDNSKVCSYIICATNKGFTLFRNIVNPKYIENPNLPVSFTFNLTENEMKFSSIASGYADNRIKNPVETLMGIYEDSVELEHQERSFHPSKGTMGLENSVVNYQTLLFK